MGSASGSFKNGLSRNALRRLVVGLINSEQKKLNKQGLIHQDQTLPSLISNLSPQEIDAVPISEDILGFDSIGTLDLILTLNRFFDLSRSGVEDYLLVKRHIGDWISLISQHRELVGDAWSFGFETSGSTGASKLVRHSASALWAEMDAQIVEPFRHIRASSRVVLLVPPYHIYGFLFGCVLPDVLGLDVIDLHYSTPLAAFRYARAGDLVVGTPFQWDMLRKTERLFCDGVFGVTSGAPSTEVTWNIIENANLTGLTEVYGATESGGIGTRTDRTAPFRLLSHLELDPQGNVHRREGDSFTVQDRLEWASRNTFHVLERCDKVVQIAGVNVSFEHVRQHILKVEGVADASVRLGQERLRAFVIPEAGVNPAVLERDLRAYIVAHLDAPARPASLDFGSEIPKNTMGKHEDWI